MFSARTAAVAFGVTETTLTRQLSCSSAAVPRGTGFFCVPTGGGFVVNVAVTDLSAVTVMTQFPVPVHPPLHPEKVESGAGAAVNVTLVPCE
jgi:hypothetical protein